MEFKFSCGEFFKNEITIVNSKILKKFQLSRFYLGIYMIKNTFIIILVYNNI